MERREKVWRRSRYEATLMARSTAASSRTLAAPRAEAPHQASSSCLGTPGRNAGVLVVARRRRGAGAKSRASAGPRGRAWRRASNCCCRRTRPPRPMMVCRRLHSPGQRTLDFRALSHVQHAARKPASQHNLLCATLRIPNAPSAQMIESSHARSACWSPGLASQRARSSLR